MEADQRASRCPTPAACCRAAVGLVIDNSESRDALGHASVLIIRLYGSTNLLDPRSRVRSLLVMHTEHCNGVLRCI